jgi:hypothetical protein
MNSSLIAAFFSTSILHPGELSVGLYMLICDEEHPMISRRNAKTILG